MAVTGVTLYRYFQQRMDSAYSGYYDNIKANALFRNTMFVCTDKRGMPPDSQKAFDEIAQQIITQRTFSINNNRISTAPLMITAVASNIGLYIISTFFPHNLLQGDTVTIQDIQGAAGTVLNGNTYTVTNIISATRFAVQTGNLTHAGTPNTGSVTTSKLIGDYLHLYAVKTRFTQLQDGLTVVSTANASPITVRLNNRSRFRDGSIMTLTGMTGTPAANGTWYVKQLNSTIYQLYTDAALTVPSTGGVSYGRPQGAVSQVFYNDATPYFSDRKIDKLDSPSAQLPKYEFAEKVIKFYPDNLVCDEINIDYIRIPQHFIDVADNTFDLSLVYPEPYLYWVIDYAIKSISTPLRDTTLNQMVSSEIIEQQ